jgi:DNA (cytosine-5)-methyltransferase 1
MSPPKITVGSLFSGIGGFELGLERADHFEPAFFVENDSNCSRALNSRWSGVRVFKDVREFSPAVRPQLLAGGFPCQDISSAGKRKGLREGTRSSLWFAFADRIRDLRPCVVLVENVADLLSKGRGFDAVLGSLSALGYDAEWDVVPASAVGAPHRRERVFVVAWRCDLFERLRAPRPADVPDAVCGGRDAGVDSIRGRQLDPTGRGDCCLVGTGPVSDALRGGRNGRALLGGHERDGRQSARKEKRGEPTGGVDRAEQMADRARGRRHGASTSGPEADHEGRPGAVGRRGRAAVVDSWRVFDRGVLRECFVRNLVGPGATWPLLSESGVGRTVARTSSGSYDADAWEAGEPRFLANCPSRGPRLRAIGNSVVPAVAEYVGRCVLQAFPSLPWVKP